MTPADNEKRQTLVRNSLRLCVDKLSLRFPFSQAHDICHVFGEAHIRDTLDSPRSSSSFDVNKRMEHARMEHRKTLAIE